MVQARGGLHAGPRAAVPGPGIAEPDGRQHVDFGRFGAAVGHSNAHQDVVGGGLGVLHDDVEVAVLGEDAGVDQFELGLAAAALPVHRGTSSSYGKAACGYLYRYFM